jgi:uncharacterized protein (TIRG00374 family)
VGTGADKLRKWLPIILGLALAGLFGWLAFRKVEWQLTWAALASANWALLALAPPLLLSSILFRAWRWRLILRGYPRARMGALALAAGIGVGANAILPGKLGEAVGAHALGRLADLSRIQSLGILVITRVVDLLVLFGLVLIASFVLPGAARTVQHFSGIVVSVSGLLLLMPVVLLRTSWGQRLLARVRGLARRVLGPAAVEAAEKFARGLASAGHWQPLAAFVASTALLWLVLSVSLLVTLRAFGIGVGPLLVPLLMSLIAASAMLPSAPGNVGTFHYFGIMALGLVGVERELAAACIITYHAMDMLSALMLGAVCGTMAGAPLLAWRTPRPQVTACRVAEAEGLVDPQQALGGLERRQPAPQVMPSAVTEES